MSIFHSLQKIRKLKTTILYLRIHMPVPFPALLPTKHIIPKKNFRPTYCRRTIPCSGRFWNPPIPASIGIRTKDSMDYYFDQGYKSLADSMTEIRFRDQLAYVISKIDCGHTTHEGVESI